MLPLTVNGLATVAKMAGMSTLIRCSVPPMVEVKRISQSWLPISQ